jgi:hypothetical protein
VDLAMLTSNVFAIETGVVTRRLENRRPATSFAWQVVQFLRVRRNKPWLPCRQRSGSGCEGSGLASTIGAWNWIIGNIQW